MVKKPKYWKNLVGDWPRSWKTDADRDAFIRRLQILRAITGDNQTEFSKRFGLEHGRWSRYETGYPIPRELAWLIHDKFPGMSIEWLWFGSTASLSPKYRDAIALETKRLEDRNRIEAEFQQAKAKLEAFDAKAKKR